MKVRTLAAIALAAMLMTGCGGQRVITREVPVEVPTPVPVYPPDAYLADCEAPALPADPPQWGEVLVYLSRYVTALAKCQSQIESLQEWRYDDDSGS